MKAPLGFIRLTLSSSGKPIFLRPSFIGGFGSRDSSVSWLAVLNDDDFEVRESCMEIAELLTPPVARDPRESPEYQPTNPHREEQHWLSTHHQAVLLEPASLIYRYGPPYGRLKGLREGHHEIGTIPFAGDVADLHIEYTPPGHYRTDAYRGQFQLGSFPVHTIMCVMEGEK